MIAELSPGSEFPFNTHITSIPPELLAALSDVMVPLLSAANCPWGNECMQASISCGNISWRVNEQDSTDGAGVSQHATKTVGGGQFPLTHSERYHNLCLEFVQHQNVGSSAETVAAAVNKFEANSVCVLIGADLTNCDANTLHPFDSNVSVYHMGSAHTIDRVTDEVPTAHWESAGIKVMIVLGLKSIYTERLDGVVKHDDK